MAIKLFALKLAPDQVGRLVAELRRLIEIPLNHPAIVRTLAAGSSGATAFLATEYVAAQSLAEWLRRQPRGSIADALPLATHLAGALDAAAAVNVHHGRLNPADVLLGQDGPRITGLGIAQALRRAGIATAVRPAFAAPDQPHDAATDRNTDIVALAAIVEELLSGARADAAAAPERSTEAFSVPVAAARSVCAGVLRRPYHHQYNSALEFADRLMTAASAPGPQSTVAPTPPRAQAAKPLALVDDRAPVEGGRKEEEESLPAQADLHSIPDAPRARERSRLTGVAVAAVLTIVLAAVGWWAMRQHPGALTAGTQYVRALGAGGAGHDRVAPVLADVPVPASDVRIQERVATPSSALAARPAARPSTAEGNVAIPPGKSADAGSAVAAGMLFIDSEPRGASVFLDAKPLGTTPVAVSALTPGEHDLRLESDGYRSWTSPVHIRPDHLNRVLVTLDR